MKRPYRFAALMLLASAATIQAQPSSSRGTKYAFLVACSAYAQTELTTLPFTTNDVEEFKKTLLTTGYSEDHIKMLHDKLPVRRYHSEKAKIMKELALLLDGIGPEDSLVVALSGHGVHFKGDATGYFCPVDAVLSDRKSLIPMDGEEGLFEQIKRCKARRKLLIVNACRNDPASDLAQAARKAQLDDEDTDTIPEGIAAIYACKQGQKSYYDPARKRGIFFDHVIRAWKGEYHNGKELRLEDFFKQVIVNTKSDVDRSLGVSQVPVVKREYSGEWVVSEKSGGSSTTVDPRPMPMPKPKPAAIAKRTDPFDLLGRKVSMSISDGKLTLKDGQGLEMWSQGFKPTHLFDLSPDRSRAAAAYGNGLFALLLPATGQLLWSERIGGASYPPKSLDFSEDGKEIVLVDADGAKFRIANKDSFELLARDPAPMGKPVDRRLDWMEGFGAKFRVGIDAGELMAVDEKAAIVWKIGLPGVKFTQFDVYPAGLRVVAFDDLGNLKCFDAKVGKEIWSVSFGNRIQRLDFSADGDLVLLKTNDGKTIRYEARTGKLAD